MESPVTNRVVEDPPDLSNAHYLVSNLIMRVLTQDTSL